MPETNRRKFLGLVSASTPILGTFSGVFNSEEDTTTIVTAKADGEPLLTKDVPTDWWEHVKHSREVLEKVKNHYMGQSGVQSLGRTSSSSAIAGRKGRAIRVRAKSFVQNDLPDKVEGIPVLVEDPVEIAPTGCHDGTPQCNIGDFDPVPGGVYLNSSHWSGTSGCAVERDGNMYLLTCEHIFRSSNEVTEDITGRNAYQNSDYFGKVDWAERDWDVATIELDNTNGQRSGFDNSIAGYFKDQGGHISKDGIEDRLYGDDLNQEGISSCSSTGPVTEMEKTLHIDWTNDGNTDYYLQDMIEFNFTSRGGDSGGPVFDIYSSNHTYCELILMAGIQSAVDTGRDCNYSFAGPCYKLADEEDFSFIPEDPDTCSGL